MDVVKTRKGATGKKVESWQDTKPLHDENPQRALRAKMSFWKKKGGDDSATQSLRSRSCPFVIFSALDISYISPSIYRVQQSAEIPTRKGQVSACLGSRTILMSGNLVLIIVDNVNLLVHTTSSHPFKLFSKSMLHVSYIHFSKSKYFIHYILNILYHELTKYKKETSKIPEAKDLLIR